MSDNYDYLCDRANYATDNFRKIAGDNSIDYYTKSKLLALNLANTNKDFAKQKYIQLLGSAAVSSALSDSLNLMEELAITTPQQLTDLPALATFISFKFKLDAPYISRDDDDFYIIDNPIRKDKVFKVPMMSAASWKGNLRWVATKLLMDKIKKINVDDFAQERFKLLQLFGSERGSLEYNNKNYAKYLDDNGPEGAKEEFEKLCANEYGTGLARKPALRGRLFFYPTFFKQIGLEVINPHSRETRTGTNPIYFETVPAGASGIFSLLYHPLSLIGKDDTKVEERIDDIKLLCQILKETMLTYGFSAKKSSGFGIANPDIELTLDRGEIPKKCIQFLIDDEFPILDKKQQQEKVERSEWKSIRPYKNAKREYMDLLNQKKEQLRKEKMNAGFQQAQISSSSNQSTDKFAELEEMLLNKIETVIE